MATKKKAEEKAEEKAVLGVGDLVWNESGREYDTVEEVITAYVLEGRVDLYRSEDLTLACKKANRQDLKGK